MFELPLVESEEELVLEFDVLTTHPVHKVPTCFFRIFHCGSGDRLGSINLRIGSSEHVERYAGHVGYAIEESHRGHGYAARALELLTQVARQLRINPLWITCDTTGDVYVQMIEQSVLAAVNSRTSAVLGDWKMPEKNLGLKGRNLKGLNEVRRSSAKSMGGVVASA